MDFVEECCVSFLVSQYGYFMTKVFIVISPHFMFQNNKHEPSFINDLIQALRKNTRLEAVEFHVRIELDLPETAIKQLLSSLKKLRYFALTYKLEVSEPAC